MACTGRFATAAQYDQLWCTDLDLTDATTLAQVEAGLDLAAADIHAAMAANGQCDCSLAAWALVYLRKLNVIDAGVIYFCPCGDLTDDRRNALRDWIDNQLELIRTGKIELCDGQTGAEYPAFGSAQQTLTEWTTAEIIENR